MSKDNLCLNFKGYEVRKIVLDKGCKLSNSKDSTGFLFKIIPNMENNFDKVNVIEGVLIEPSEEFDYKLEVIIKGNFELLNCKDDNEKYKYILVNAAAILYPYLRAIVGIMSSQIDYENIVLPVMNFHKLFEKQEPKELILDANQFEDF